VDANRQNALELSQEQTKADPLNAFTWFNLGSNLVYFERYAEAARAYDQARQLGLPQRMLRYQFGPFFAYFFSSRNADLLSLTEYALKITPIQKKRCYGAAGAITGTGKKPTPSLTLPRPCRNTPTMRTLNTPWILSPVTPRSYEIYIGNDATCFPFVCSIFLF